MAIDRVTFGPGGYGFDELVADDASVHVERMANNHVWMAIESGGRRVVLNLHSSRRGVLVNVYDEPAMRPQLYREREP